MCGCRSRPAVEAQRLREHWQPTCGCSRWRLRPRTAKPGLGHFLSSVPDARNSQDRSLVAGALPLVNDLVRP